MKHEHDSKDLGMSIEQFAARLFVLVQYEAREEVVGPLERPFRSIIAGWVIADGDQKLSTGIVGSIATLPAESAPFLGDLGTGATKAGLYWNVSNHGKGNNAPIYRVATGPAFPSMKAWTTIIGTEPPDRLLAAALCMQLGLEPPGREPQNED